MSTRPRTRRFWSLSEKIHILHDWRSNAVQSNGQSQQIFLDTHLINKRHIQSWEKEFAGWDIEAEWKRLAGRQEIHLQAHGTDNLESLQLASIEMAISQYQKDRGSAKATMRFIRSVVNMPTFKPVEFTAKEDER